MKTLTLTESELKLLHSHAQARFIECEQRLAKWREHFKERPNDPTALKIIGPAEQAFVEARLLKNKLNPENP